MMALLLTTLASLAGITLLVITNRWLLGDNATRISTLDQATHALQQDLLSFAAGDGVLSADQRSAVVVAQDGASAGLVLAMGRGLVTRRLTPQSGWRVETHAAGLTLHFDDITLPQAAIALPLDVAAIWAAKLQGLARHAAA
jgi:hypothetical protein